MKKNVVEKYSKQVEDVRAYYDRNDNIFKIMRLDKETAHSRFIAWLLNSNASHGLGDGFLRFVLERTHGVEFVENSLKTERITNEEWLETIKENGETEVEEKSKKGKRPVDVLVLAEDSKSKKKFVLSIENKYGSFEHGGQCVDYINSIKKKYIRDEGCYYFVYLDIKEPPDFGENEDRYGDYKFLCYENVMKYLKKQLKTLPESVTRLYL